jgi:hypothetical protein
VRRVNWKRLGITAIAIVFVWFVNYNFALKRWDDQIDGCNYSKHFRDLPNAAGWRTAAIARRASYKKTGDKFDLRAARGYDHIVASLNKVIATPCDKRFHRPGVFG